MAPSAQTPAHWPATLEDFLAIPPHERFHEMLDGELVRKVMPGGNHATVQRRLAGLLDGYYQGSVRRQPGGWWLMTEVEVLLPWEQAVRPDLAGWRCDRMPEVPEEFPLRLLPNWVCEVVSPSDPRRDTVIKYRDYAKAGIPYYWLVDLKSRRLTALKLSGEHYVEQAEAEMATPCAASNRSSTLKLRWKSCSRAYRRVARSAESADSSPSQLRLGPQLEHGIGQSRRSAARARPHRQRKATGARGRARCSPFEWTANGRRAAQPFWLPSVGDRGAVRTRDLRFRKPLLYPAELRSRETRGIYQN